LTTKPSLGTYRAVNDQVTTTDWNNILDFGRYTQEMLLGTNTDKIVGAALSQVPQYEKNILTNPGFEIWQRGNGPIDGSAAQAQAGADGWIVLGGHSTRDTGTVDGSATSLKFDSNGSGATIYQITVEVEKYRSKQLSVSGRVIGAAAASGYVFLQDDFNIYNGQVTALGAFTTLTATGVIASNASIIYVGFVAQQNATYYLDNFMLTQTPGPVPYVPLDPVEEWLRVRHRYQKLPFNCRFRTNSTNEHHQFTIPFIRMNGIPAAPIVDMTGSSQANLLANPTVTNFSDTFATIDVVGSAANADTFITGATLIVDTITF
jgi:hypothetical protein